MSNSNEHLNTGHNDIHQHQAEGHSMNQKNDMQHSSDMSHNGGIQLVEDLSQVCSVTYSAICQMARLLGRESELSGSKDAEVKAACNEALAKGWAQAFKSKAYKVSKPGQPKETISFSFALDAPNAAAQKVAVVSMMRSNQEKGKLPYYIVSVHTPSGARRRFGSLYKFALVTQEQRAALGRMALPEPWSFCQGEGDTGILASYLNSTFLRLEDEGKIVRAKDSEGEATVFNTGLVDNTFKDIYCFCVPSYAKDGAPWKVSSFCEYGVGHDGQRITGMFGDDLPQRANYFADKSDIFYDPTLRLVTDYNHLLLRLGRVDLWTLRHRMFKHSDAALAVIGKAEALPDSRDREKALNEGLREVIKDDPALEARVTKIFEDACTVAQARARYMYSSVIPAWNHKDYQGGEMFFCMPLCLARQGHVDTVLVVALQKDAPHPYYAGKTLLSLEMAYRNARVVQRTDGMTGWIAGAFEDAGRQVRANGGEEMSAFGFTPSNYNPPRAVAKEGSGESQRVEQAPARKAGPSAAVGSPKSEANEIPPAAQRHQSARASVETAQTVAIPRQSAPTVAPQLTLRHSGPEGTWEFLVHSGDVIGRYRDLKKAKPDIVLPNDDVNFKYVSQEQGKFVYENGVWFFCQLKQKNTTELFHGRGTSKVLQKGDRSPLAAHDELSFALSPRFEVRF